MIRKVVIRRFKRFQDTTFEFPGHVVIAGPNNAGKTTVLQAIAAWSLSYKQWKTLNNFNPRNGYQRMPIARQAFSSVPLRTYDLLWRDRGYREPIEIEIQHSAGWSLCMEFVPDSTEQIFVHPKATVPSLTAQNANLDVVFVPAMSGLSKEEPLYAVPATIESLLGQARPGDVLRNLLVQAHQSPVAWDALQKSIDHLFGYELLPPNANGAYIIAEYRPRAGARELDIGGAGSGFQQILMLLTFLNTKPASVLLLDEPDAHLHIILQDAIWNELKEVARRQNSQLIIATHSEVIINAVEPRDLCILVDQPRQVTGEQEKQILADSMRLLSNTDIMLAIESKGILYLEGSTDLNILREWAKVLKHKLYELIDDSDLMWRPVVADQRLKGTGIKSTDHHKALTLVNANFPALELVDGDANAGIQSTDITGRGYQRLRWNRYEIESYLLHPAALERFVQSATNTTANDLPTQDLRKHFQQNYPPQFIANPFEDLAFIKNTKARTELLPPALAAAGLPGFPYQRFGEIASIMLPDEIHPEVKEKLDLILKAFNA